MDATAGTARPPEAPDPRVLPLVTEAYRHCKAVGGRNGAEHLLETCGIGAHDPGIAVGDDSAAIVEDPKRALGKHRAWDRFPAALSGWGRLGRSDRSGRFRRAHGVAVWSGWPWVRRIALRRASRRCCRPPASSSTTSRSIAAKGWW